MSPRGSLMERLRRFLLTDEELNATQLRERARGAGAQSIAEAPPRSRVTFRGTVTSVTSDAQHGWLEAELSDGSGVVRLVWMGRSRIECLLPGREMQVNGRLAQDAGAPVIYNPDFEIFP